jgi:GTP cyclohydrolase II
VYNARKRQVGGDRADKYFLRTECVAGVQDMRFQELMPDVLHWLGIRKIHRLVSMSNDKHSAITGSGIEVGERIKIPDEHRYCRSCDEPLVGVQRKVGLCWTCQFRQESRDRRDYEEGA